jgi:hypothetical protein
LYVILAPNDSGLGITGALLVSVDPTLYQASDLV